MGFAVKDASTGEVLPGLPSPLLIQQGGGQAWRVPYEGTPDPYHPRQVDHGFWRLRDDSYDPPGTEYQRVRIVHTEQYYVEVEVEDLEDVDNPDAEPWTVGVHVEAEDRDQARRMGMSKALQHEQEDNPQGNYRANWSRAEVF